MLRADVVEARAASECREAGFATWNQGVDRIMKYGNNPCKVGFEKYRSERERDRHQTLLLLQRAGRISGLTREVPFILAQGVKIIGEPRARPALRYFADFVYTTDEGRMVVEDAKGMQTAMYRLKKHLMATVHGISVQES